MHQGNGTAAIFAGDPTVYTLSIHQLNNYPYPKPPSTLDIHLHDGVEDDEYLAALEDGLDQALAEFKPDLIFYVAGADPYREDQLGGLKLSLDGLERRDRMVFEKARATKIPVAVTLAGGYARRRRRHDPNPHQYDSNRQRVCALGAGFEIRPYKSFFRSFHPIKMMWLSSRAFLNSGLVTELKSRCRHAAP